MTEEATYSDSRELVARPDLLVTETDSWVASVADVIKLAGYICNTPFVPVGLRGSAPATAATILYGREIGVPPITALQTMHVINGRVGMAAELMRARVFAAGHEIEVTESTAAVCRMRGRRRGSETWTAAQWTIGDARQAGLGAGDGWKKYPRAMLVARCSAELCRLVFPDVTHGMAALEEIDGEAIEGRTAAETPAPTRKVTRAGRGALTAGNGGTVDPAGGPPPPTTPTPGEGSRVPTLAHASPPVSVPIEPPTPAAPAVTTPPGPVAPPELEEPRPAGLVPGPWTEPELPSMPSPEPREDELDPLDDGDPRAHAALEGDGPASRAQLRHVMVLFRKLGTGSTREDRLRVGGGLVGRRLTSFSELSLSEASKLITTLLFALGTDNPRQYVRWLVDEQFRRMDEAEASGGIGDE